MSEALARDLEALADLFKAGGWREIRIEAAGLGVLLSADPTTHALGAAQQAVAGPMPTLSELAASTATNDAQTAGIDDNVSRGGAPDPIWHAVVAPNLGTFYRSPKPGSPPFVELGQRVTVETEICLLEVMKLFTSVKAGVAGTIRRIDADDSALVEGGQMLFHIEPE